MSGKIPPHTANPNSDSWNKLYGSVKYKENLSVHFDAVMWDYIENWEIYCKTLYFCCVLISQFWNVEISLHSNLAFSQCSASIYQALDGQLNFRGYLISQFYATREICENLLHMKICFTVGHLDEQFCFVHMLLLLTSRSTGYMYTRILHRLSTYCHLLQITLPPPPCSGCQVATRENWIVGPWHQFLHGSCWVAVLSDQTAILP